MNGLDEVRDRIIEERSRDILRGLLNIERDLNEFLSDWRAFNESLCSAERVRSAEAAGSATRPMKIPVEVVVCAPQTTGLPPGSDAPGREIGPGLRCAGPIHCFRDSGWERQWGGREERWVRRVGERELDFHRTCAAGSEPFWVFAVRWGEFKMDMMGMRDRDRVLMAGQRLAGVRILELPAERVAEEATSISPGALAPG
jgi:hypothetical protein